MLSLSDSDVIAYLNKYDGGWTETKTVSPTDVSVMDVTFTSVEISRTPVLYTADGGYYEIAYATSPGGPYAVHGQTGNKTVSTYVVDGLEASQEYYFAVRTFNLPMP